MFGQPWDWKTNLLDRVQELLVDLRSHSPKLKRVVIRQMAWFPEQLADCEKECQELGPIVLWLGLISMWFLVVSGVVNL